MVEHSFTHGNFSLIPGDVLGDLQKKMEAFHDHLDVCPQCSKHPFGLCGEGAEILHRVDGSPSPDDTAKP